MRQHYRCVENRWRLKLNLFGNYLLSVAFAVRHGDQALFHQIVGVQSYLHAPPPLAFRISGQLLLLTQTSLSPSIACDCTGCHPSKCAGAERDCPNQATSYHSSETALAACIFRQYNSPPLGQLLTFHLPRWSFGPASTATPRVHLALTIEEGRGLQYSKKTIRISCSSISQVLILTHPWPVRGWYHQLMSALAFSVKSFD